MPRLRSLGGAFGHGLRSLAQLLLVLLVLLVLFVLPGPGAANTSAQDATPRTDVHVAIAAYDDKAVVERQLAPFLAAFDQQLPGYNLRVAILELDELELALAINRADVILTNPYHYLRLRESDHLAGAVATVYRSSPGGRISSLGGTIVTRADRADITSLQDLRGRSVAIADRRNTGGFVLPLAELRRAGIARSELRLVEVGRQRAAIDAVLTGEVDAAFLRSSLLESLMGRGALENGVLKVINRQSLGDFPFAVSTRLYPEWPMVMTGGANRELLARLLGISLLRPGGARVDDLGAVAGLTTPSDYSVLERELELLQLPPYDIPREVTVVDIWRAHRLGVIGAVVGLLVITALMLALAERNRRLRHLWKNLQNSLRAQEADRQRLTDLNRHFELFLDRTTDFVYFKDAARRFVFVSRSFATLTGTANRHSLEGKTDSDVFPEEVAREYYDQESILFDTRQPIIDQRQRLRRLDGTMGWVSTCKWPVFSPQGDEVLGLFGISRDVTERYFHERELERAAHYDSLTGLPNRDLFFDRLNQAMASTERRGTELAVVYLDIDNFKQINDHHGHAVGDGLLEIFADVLTSEVRRTDTVCRLGGDEFALLLADLRDRDECLSLMDRLMQVVAQPRFVGKVSLEVTASAGLAFFKAGDDSDSDLLLRRADQAMYRAKQAGRNRYRLLDEDQDQELRSFLAQVSSGIREGQFELHYQPMVNMHSGELVGAEALLRWRKDDEGLLTSREFLPMVFGQPVAVELERWMIRHALEQQSRWRRSGMALRMHINVTTSDISAPGFTGMLEEQLGQTLDGDGSGVSLEILESTAVADPNSVNAAIEACSRMGVQFALDDFGTGYSSIASIKDLRAACVKIDQRFVGSMYRSYDDFSLLVAILAMARAFDRQVVAEGVETTEQGEMLLRLGCPVAQGSAIAPAMPADEFATWARDWQSDPRWQAIDDEQSALLPDLWRAGREAWLQQTRRGDVSD